MGWAPALGISGTNWVAPILGQLFDDPYAAVRCVSERSLKMISESIPSGYDYSTDPRTRPPVRDLVWLSWQRKSLPNISEPRASRVLFRAGDYQAQQALYNQWLEKRDDHPVRLRE